MSGASGTTLTIESKEAGDPASLNGMITVAGQVVVRDLDVNGRFFAMGGSAGSLTPRSRT